MLIHLSVALRSSPDVEIYWQCFADGEADDIWRTVRGFNERLNRTGGEIKSESICSRLRFWVARDAGFFLFELFQGIYRSLPPGGADFPAMHRVAPQPYRQKGAVHRQV